MSAGRVAEQECSRRSVRGQCRHPVPDRATAVDFAIRFQGRNCDTAVVAADRRQVFRSGQRYRLVAAQSGRRAGARVEGWPRAEHLGARRVAHACAKKYFEPPHTNRFRGAIPAHQGCSGGFAAPGRPMRNPELRVVVAAPPRLLRCLNSLRWDFERLAIEQRSSSLAGAVAVKTEFARLRECAGLVRKTGRNPSSQNPGACRHRTKLCAASCASRCAAREQALRCCRRCHATKR